MQNNELTVEKLIKTLGLQSLPGEGGLFSETYRSTQRIPATEDGPEKPCGSAIFYLLTAQPDSFSALHRLKSDEIYHFYLGDPLEMTLLYPDGTARQVILGQDVLNGQHLQLVVPAGVWQGSQLVSGGRYALVGTTMAPAYMQEDFELGQRAGLLERWPQASENIRALTRS